MNSLFRTNKIAALFLLGLLSLSGALYLAGDQMGNGLYETNIYQAYPLTFWLAIILTICLGLTIGFLAVFTRSGTYQWVYGVLLIAATNILIVSLQYFRNYAFISQWDDVNHYSDLLNLLGVQQPASTNFYPASHVLAAIFSLLTGVSANKTILIFPAIYYAIFILNVIFAAWVIHRDPAVRGLIVLLSSPLIYTTYSTIFRPTHFSVYMLPFFLGCFAISRYWRRDWRDTLPLICLIFYVPFLHPWAVILCVVMIFGFGAAALFNKILGDKKTGPYNLTVPILLLGITWTSWFTTFQIFGSSLRRILDSFVQALTGSHSLYGYIEKANQARLPLAKIFTILLFTYGPTIFYYSIAIFFVIFVLLPLLRRSQKVKISEYVLSLSSFLVICILLAFLSLFRDIVAEGPGRFLNFGLGIIPLMVGSYLYSYISRKKRHHLRRFTGEIVVLQTFIMGTAVLGVFGTYYSPLLGQPSHQLSYAQQAGIRFFVKNATLERDDIVYEIFNGEFGLASVLTQDELTALRKKSSTWWFHNPPKHFGYTPSAEADHFTNPAYLITNAYEVAYYTDVWPEGGSFTPADFEALSRDPAWHLIYTTLDYTIWKRSHFNP